VVGVRPFVPRQQKVHRELVALQGGLQGERSARITQRTCKTREIRILLSGIDISIHQFAILLVIFEPLLGVRVGERDDGNELRGGCHVMHAQLVDERARAKPGNENHTNRKLKVEKQNQRQRKLYKNEQQNNQNSNIKRKQRELLKYETEQT
jgi:hypothetical protein